MKAITLWQPFASAVAQGIKQNETRSWLTKYRGPLVIAAAKNTWAMMNMPRLQWDRSCRALDVQSLTDLPLGTALCVCELVDVVRTEILVKDMSDTEILFGDWTPNRYAWRLKNVRVFPQPIPIKGAQGLYTCPTEIAVVAERL